MTKIKIYIVLLISLAACAIQRPPSGGPPDKTPPEILETYPKGFTTNFKDDFVSFNFNKYMNKSQVIENLFITPDIKVNYDWSGKELNIEFEESLKPNTTYSISLGTDYTDLKGNKPEIAYTIIFSTGEKIDSCKISGKLFDKNPGGTFIFAYSLDGINPDTLNPMHTKPTYRTQIGKNGLFFFGALKPGKYRVFAIKDQMKDGQYDQGIDRFSAYKKDIISNDTLTPHIQFKLGPAIDDVGPMLYGVEPLTRSALLAEFSETLDSSTIKSRAFKITDSTGTKNIPVSAAFLNVGSSNIVKIISQNPLDTATKWLLQVRADGRDAICDSTGNVLQDTASTSFFFAVPEKDTNALKLYYTTPADSSKNIPTNAAIDFIFNNSIIKKKDKISIKFVANNSEKNIKFKTINPQENILRLMPEKRLKSLTDYKIELKNLFNNSDTTIYLTFQTADERDFGGLAGVIIDSSDYSGAYLVILTAKETEKQYYYQTKNKKWKFDHLPPGDYSMEIISDISDDGEYNYGYPYPWRPAEKFMIINGTIRIKPRWTVEDFKIIYRGK